MDTPISELSAILAIHNELRLLTLRVERAEQQVAELQFQRELQDLDYPHPMVAYSLPEIEED